MNASNSFRSAKSRLTSSMRSSLLRTDGSTSITDSIGTKSKSPPRKIWKASALAGASTITQQLVKNLFYGTNRSFLRKGAEASLVPVAELVLGKRRILELYLNLIEWGPGVYGAESACLYHDRISARNINREQAARLAAILPAPLKRRPERMNNYSAIILKRMEQRGW